jgi:HK97 family phage major capsid protein
MEYQVALDNAMTVGGRRGIICHPRTQYNAAKLKDTTNRPLFDWEAQGENGVGTMRGIPVRTTTQIPITLSDGSATTCSEIYYSPDWRQLWIGFWGPMRVEATIEAGDANGSAFTNDQLWIKAVRLYDVTVRRGNYFCVIADVL